MKKLLGILLLSIACIGLGRSVKWFKEQGTTLVSANSVTDIAILCYE